MAYNKENPLRVVTLCSGYDSQCMALDKLKEAYPDFDYDLVAWSEIDKYAILSHNAIYPQYADRNLGDMTKIDWSKIEGPIDLLTYSTPCFVEGTLVMTSNGLKAIDDITNEDFVLTHTNNYMKVLKPMVRNYKGEMVNIKAMCFDDLDCTPEHPFYVRTMSRKGHLWKRVFSEPVWKNAKDLTKYDYLGVAINHESKMPEWNGVEDNRYGHHITSNKLSALFTNNSFWYLMGRYIGDGWKRNVRGLSYGIVICCNDTEKDKDSLIEAISNCGFNYTISKERTVNKVSIYSKELYKFVERYGYYAYGKKVDGETLNLPVEHLEHFIKGYLASDGSYHKDTKLYKITSISKELIYGIAQCVAKVYKIPYKIYYNKRTPTCVIEDRTVNQSPQWQICWKTEKSKQDRAFYEDGYIWCPIRSIETFDACCNVYNMEVAEDNSYTANGAIVHNCTDLSQAGQQKGMEEGSGTRSSILWYTRNAIKHLKPKFLMLENVKALVTKKFMPYFEQWLQELESYGYYNAWQVCNARDYGIPQNRERVFVISILKDEDNQNPYYEFPEPFPLDKCLADVLDDDVEENFYLSDERISSLMATTDTEKLAGRGFSFVPDYNG